MIRVGYNKAGIEDQGGGSPGGSGIVQLVGAAGSAGAVWSSAMVANSL